MATPAVITAAVEGSVDEAMLRRLCKELGATVGNVYGKSGKSSVLKHLNGFNNSARHRHWVVLLDLDNDSQCPSTSLQNWLPAPAPLMCLRIAVREVESWILADRERVASFLGIRVATVPENPDALGDPKLMLVNLARDSRFRSIREDIVPRPGSGQSVGPAYSSRMIEFIYDIQSGWRLNQAAANSESLRRSLAAVSQLVLRAYPPDA